MNDNHKKNKEGKEKRNIKKCYSELNYTEYNEPLLWTLLKKNTYSSQKIYGMKAFYHFIGQINQKQCKKCIFL